MVGHFGTASYYSFQWNKPFTTGLGGMAVTNNNQLAKRIEEVISAEIIQPSNKEIFMLWAQLCVYRLFIYPRTTALAQNLFRFLTKKGLVVGSSSTAEFNPEKPKDFFKAMSSVQAGSGINQLEKLEKNIAHRKKIASLYDQLLKEKGFPARNYDPSIMDPVMVRYPVRITEKKKALQDAASAGVELGSWFESPLHPEETPLKPYGYIEGMCPHAEKACNQVVNLPLHPRVSEKTARHTVDFIAKYPKP
jgi:dTDP-4-amino-4,6-dideoxygalactose transaminase